MKLHLLEAAVRSLTESSYIRVVAPYGAMEISGRCRQFGRQEVSYSPSEFVPEGVMLVKNSRWAVRVDIPPRNTGEEFPFAVMSGVLGNIPEFALRGVGIYPPRPHVTVALAVSRVSQTDPEPAGEGEDEGFEMC